MTAVIVMGDRAAGDDAAGPLVGDALRAAGVDVLETSDVVAIADALAAAPAAIVVDAASGPGPAGAVHLLDAPMLARERRASSHGLGLREAIALARAQGSSPVVRVYAIVGSDFRVGAATTPAVRDASARVAEEVRRCV